MEFLGSAGSTALLASVESGTSATVTDLIPVVGLVGGIILAFIGIRFIVSLAKKAGK